MNRSIQSWKAIACSVQTEIVKFDSFDDLGNIEKSCTSIWCFDASCKELHLDKDIIELVTTRRHPGLVFLK